MSSWPVTGVCEAHEPKPNTIILAAERQNDEAGDTELNQLLQDLRSEAEGSQVEVGIQKEMELLKAEVRDLDPITKREAADIAKKLGAKYSAVHTQLDKPEARAEARRIFRQMIALALKLESPTDKIEIWFERHPKSWYFLSEIIAISGAVLGADLAVKAGAPLIPTVVITYKIGLAIIGSGWVPGLLWSWAGKHDKTTLVFKSFFRGAGIYQNGGYSAIYKDAEKVSRQLGYPKRFMKCALSLQRLSN